MIKPTIILLLTFLVFPAANAETPKLFAGHYAGMQFLDLLKVDNPKQLHYAYGNSDICPFYAAEGHQIIRDIFKKYGVEPLDYHSLDYTKKHKLIYLTFFISCMRVIKPGPDDYIYTLSGNFARGYPEPMVSYDESTFGSAKSVGMKDSMLDELKKGVEKGVRTHAYANSDKYTNGSDRNFMEEMQEKWEPLAKGECE